MKASALVDQHGLTAEEYERIVRMLGRPPSPTELAMFSVMWSEHCSYKSSRVHLQTLPTSGPRVVQGPGENAGAVDIGDGLAAVFKIESHNHPSFIEPYQGAATGVGGIIRDIFTMGARPVALLNSLRFGSLADNRSRRIMEGVVAGIAGYGNSIGVPTIGGEIAFDESYAGNPLVNVLCLGIAPSSDLVRGLASGPGNSVYYVGAKTGRDGIHGATMASAEFDEKSSEKRPAVQVGDPFMEKLLLEACLELLKSGAIVGIQDMGAAGLACATAEMAARAGTGIAIDISRVPQREPDMAPYDIMLSESQERMLLVAQRGREADVERIFQKWDLHAARIGYVTDDGVLRVTDRTSVVAELQARALVDEAPRYRRPALKPASLEELRAFDPTSIERAVAPEGDLLVLLSSPDIASKRWVYRQYDHMVRTNTIVLAGRGTPVIRIKGTSRAVAISLDGNGRYSVLDPRLGSALAVAEAARNVACAGALPIGATNCLNFGNPERSGIMWQFTEAVAGLAEACRALEIPITGGNVSFYNETEGRAIYPTAVVGVIGVLEDAARVLQRPFRAAGQAIVLLGRFAPTLGGSEYLKVKHQMVRGVPPAVDLAAERALHHLIVASAQDGWLQSAHDCAEGGLAVTLAECCFDANGIGASVELSLGHLGLAALLFGETASSAIVTVAPERVSELVARARSLGIAADCIGTTGGSRVRIRVGDRGVVDVAVADAEQLWQTGLERYFVRKASTHA